MDRTAPKGNILILALVGAFFLALLSVGAAVTYFKTKPNIPYRIQQQGTPTPLSKGESPDFNNYTSDALKISFKYPSSWYVDEKNFSILITSYKTFIGEGKIAEGKDMQIDLDRVSLCQQNIEQNLIYGGCGENQKILNKILNKEIKANLEGVTFSKFLVKFPDSSDKTLYYLEKGSIILQVTKHPDPSQFEKEFEEIVNSIKFFP